MLILDGISAVCRKNISEVAGTGRNGTCALSAEVLHSTKRKSNNSKGMLRRGRISKILAKKNRKHHIFLISAHAPINKCIMRTYGKSSKISNIFLFSSKILVFKAGIHKKLVRIEKQ